MIELEARAQGGQGAGIEPVQVVDGGIHIHHPHPLIGIGDHIAPADDGPAFHAEALPGEQVIVVEENGFIDIRILPLLYVHHQVVVPEAQFAAGFGDDGRTHHLEDHIAGNIRIRVVVGDAPTGIVPDHIPRHLDQVGSEGGSGFVQVDGVAAPHIGHIPDRQKLHLCAFLSESRYLRIKHFGRQPIAPDHIVEEAALVRPAQVAEARIADHHIGIVVHDHEMPPVADRIRHRGAEGDIAGQVPHIAMQVVLGSPFVVPVEVGDAGDRISGDGLDLDHIFPILGSSEVAAPGHHQRIADLPAPGQGVELQHRLVAGSIRRQAGHIQLFLAVDLDLPHGHQTEGKLGGVPGVAAEDSDAVGGQGAAGLCYRGIAGQGIGVGIEAVVWPHTVGHVEYGIPVAVMGQRIGIPSLGKTTVPRLVGFNIKGRHCDGYGAIIRTGCVKSDQGAVGSNKCIEE